jgi:hypothetical protein
MAGRAVGEGELVFQRESCVPARSSSAPGSERRREKVDVAGSARRQHLDHHLRPSASRLPSPLPADHLFHKQQTHLRARPSAYLVLPTNMRVSSVSAAASRAQLLLCSGTCSTPSPAVLATAASTALVRPYSSSLSPEASSSRLPLLSVRSPVRRVESRRAIHIPYVEDTVSCPRAAGACLSPSPSLTLIDALVRSSPRPTDTTRWLSDRHLLAPAQGAGALCRAGASYGQPGATSAAAPPRPPTLMPPLVLARTRQVNDTMSTLIVASLLYLEAIDPKKPIMMYINSPGGVVSSGLAIYDTVRLSSPSVPFLRPVAADVQGLSNRCSTSRARCTRSAWGRRHRWALCCSLAVRPPRGCLSAARPL